MRLLIVLTSCFLIGCFGKSPTGQTVVLPYDTLTASVEHLYKRKGTSYQQSRSDCAGLRQALKNRFEGAVNDSLRNRILKEAGDILTTALIEDIIPWWYGTPWTFVGHTSKPNAGEVACGYFVSTTLQQDLISIVTSWHNKIR